MLGKRWRRARCFGFGIGKAKTAAGQYLCALGLVQPGDELASGHLRVGQDLWDGEHAPGGYAGFDHQLFPFGCAAGDQHLLDFKIYRFAIALANVAVGKASVCFQIGAPPQIAKFLVLIGLVGGDTSSINRP